MKPETIISNQDIQFRSAAAADTDAILELYRAATVAGQKQGTTDWDLEYPNAETIAYDLSQNGLFVLTDGRNLLGAVTMIPQDDLDDLPLDWTPGRTCVLARMCVHPGAQGRGLAKRLLKEVREEAKARGYVATRHMSVQSVAVTTHLYRSLRFREVGVAHLYDSDFYCFEKEL